MNGQVPYPLSYNNTWQKGHMGLDFSPMEQLAPIVPIVIAIGSPLVPLAIHPLVPLAMVIANGANGDHHWSQWRSPLAANGDNKMAPMANLYQWIAIGANGDPMVPMNPMDPLAPMNPFVPMMIH